MNIIKKCGVCGRIGEGHWEPVNVVVINNTENIEFAFVCPHCHEITYSLQPYKFDLSNNESLLENTEGMGAGLGIELD